MSFIAGKKLASVDVFGFDIGGTFQNFSKGIFRPDGSGEGCVAYLQVPFGDLTLNPDTLRLEANGTMFLRLVDAKGGFGAIVIRNEARISCSSASTGKPVPFDAVPTDIRASGFAVDGRPWSLVSTASEVQGVIGGVDVYVIHVELEIG